MPTSAKETLKIKPYSINELEEIPTSNFETRIDQERLAQTASLEIAKYITHLKPDEGRIVLRPLSPEKTSEILSEIDTELSAEILSMMSESKAIKILEKTPPDDATDIISELEDEAQKTLISKLTDKTAKTLKQLLDYPPETAGGIMTPDFSFVNPQATASQAIAYIRTTFNKTENVYYVYVLDTDQHLLGVLSMRDLILAEPEQKVSEFMQTKILGICAPLDDREKAARLMANYNLLSLPVVDDKNHLLGIVTHDDVIDILESEATEDLQIMVGAGRNEGIYDNISYSFKKRSPWLVINLVTAFAAAGVVYCFKDAIEKLSLLAVFMPIIASLGGNAGAQTLAVAIRSIALEEVRDGDGLTICIREGIKGLANSLIVGLITVIAVLIVTQSAKISAIVFLAMILNMIVAGASGAFIPLILKRMDCDPAQSSSIFLTAVTDIAGFLIFLSLGAQFLL